MVYKKNAAAAVGLAMTVDAGCWVLGVGGCMLGVG